MSIEDEIAAVKAAAQKKLQRLRERERKEQQVLDQRVIELLRSQHSVLAGQLDAAAREALKTEAAMRSGRAKAARSPGAVPSVNTGGGGDAQVQYGGPGGELVR